MLSRIVLLPLLIMSAFSPGYAQLTSKFAVTENAAVLPASFLGTWLLIDKKEEKEEESNPSEPINARDYVIITAFGDSKFQLQTLTFAKYSDNKHYESTLYRGYISSLDGSLFLNVKEIELGEVEQLEEEAKEAEEDAEDEESEDSPLATEYETEFTIFKLDVSKGQLQIRQIVSSRRNFDTQEAFTEYVRSNMKNSFFYEKDGYSVFNGKLLVKP